MEGECGDENAAEEASHKEYESGCVAVDHPASIAAILRPLYRRRPHGSGGIGGTGVNDDEWSNQLNASFAQLGAWRAVGIWVSGSSVRGAQSGFGGIFTSGDQGAGQSVRRWRQRCLPNVCRSLGEQFYTDARWSAAHPSWIKPPSQGDCAPKHVGANGAVP
jgi:hypothetical protein